MGHASERASESAQSLLTSREVTCSVGELLGQHAQRRDTRRILRPASAQIMGQIARHELYVIIKMMIIVLAGELASLERLALECALKAARRHEQPACSHSIAGPATRRRQRSALSSGIEFRIFKMTRTRPASSREIQAAA